MSDIEAMRSRINDLHDLIAQERLRNDANSREPAAKKGVFVDPFFDDDMRDQGITQTAAIVDHELTLPISGSVQDVGKGITPWLLPKVHSGSLLPENYRRYTPAACCRRTTVCFRAGP
jgi:hypothetical protein